jgi:glycosyltransferase involved in cell wall biosynthesis
MRLLYLTADPGVPVFGHKGASVHVREMVGALQRAGAEVVVASPRVEDEGGGRLLASTELASIMPVHPRTHTSPASIRAAVSAQREEVERLCGERRVDAVYERYSLFSDAGVCAARRLGLPHILEVNAPLRAEARRYRVLPHPRLAAEIESGVFALTSRCICVSEAVATAVQRSHPAAPVEVVPNGVDPERFPGPRTRPAGGAFVVGFAGSLKPWHGIETLIEACRLAFRAELRLRLEIVGAGPMRAAVEWAGLPPDRVFLSGPTPHERALESMRNWDVGVAPYRGEPGFYFSPLKVLEYMATGICPVASDLGELRSLLGEGRGVLVPPDDPQALAGVLIDLSRSTDLAAGMGRRARAWVLTNRTWAGNAAVVLDRLREAPRSEAA